MIQCQMCEKKFKNNRVFSIHLRNLHNMTSEKYFVEILGNTIGNCKICKQPTKFKNIEIGYSTYCSVKCCNKDPQRQIQIKNAMQLKYGVSNPSQADEIKKKKKETLIEHYGVDSPLKSPIIRERSRITSLERYGEDHYAKTNESQIIFESTCLKRYGVKRPLQADQFIQKSIDTCISKFGTPYASQSLEVKNKMSKINILNSFKRLIYGDRLKDKFKPLFDINDFKGLDNYKKYMWECLTCNTEFESSADNGFLPRCPTCNPKITGRSRYEQELLFFLLSLNKKIIQNELYNNEDIMVECQICKKTFKNLRGLTTHLRKTKESELQVYYDKFISDKLEHNCPICNNPTRFVNLIEGYRTYCSVSCMNQSDEHKQLVKEGVRKKYGVDCVFQNYEVKKMIKNTMMIKYGVENAFQSEEVKETIRQTNLDKFGVENPLQSKDIREKCRQTMVEAYGVEYPLQSNKVKEKMKQTNLERYGVENVLNVPEIQNNIIQSNKKKFFKTLISSNRLQEKCIPNFAIDEFHGVVDAKKYSWICTKCNNEFEDNIDDGHVPRCPNCYPKYANRYSRYEEELHSNLKDLYIDFVINDRSIISPLELDIYITSHNLAIEFDGLYWHSEIGGNHISRDYHLNKTIQCQEKGIQLLHIFEDEWRDKQEIVKSIIKSKLGLCQKLYARKCQLKEVPNDEAILFLFDNHLQGSINGIHLGLYYEDDLVIMITVGKPRFNKNYEYELLRFCNKINISVIGGFSKLLKFFINMYKPKSIVTYSDIRYSMGNTYDQFGFTLLDKTYPSYYYLDKAYMNRISRLHFQKHLLEDKLDIFDSTLTEWQNMQLNNYDRIWDCGCNKHAWINEEVIMELGSTPDVFGKLI